MVTINLTLQQVEILINVIDNALSMELLVKQPKCSMRLGNFWTSRINWWQNQRTQRKKTNGTRNQN